MTTQRTDFTVAPVKLTDGSIAFNVQGVVDGQQIVIGANDQKDAESMVEMLNAAAWIEVMEDAA